MEGPTAPGASCSTRRGTREKDATEFADAAHTAVEGLPDKAQVSTPTAKRVTILIASDDATLQALDGIFGATGS